MTREEDISQRIYWSITHQETISIMVKLGVFGIGNGKVAITCTEQEIEEMYMSIYRQLWRLAEKTRPR